MDYFGHDLGYFQAALLSKDAVLSECSIYDSLTISDLRFELSFVSFPSRSLIFDDFNCALADIRPFSNCVELMNGWEES